MQMIFEKISGGQGGEDTLKMVYDELREDGLPGVSVISRKEPDEEDREYITAALEGVLAHREEIDEMIEKTAKGWSIDRMSLVDLTILRLAVWEILYADDVPGSVSIAEAMELTERFSDPEDKSFVNGILGTVLREYEART
jgi:N utilization substance protein B